MRWLLALLLLTQVALADNMELMGVADSGVNTNEVVYSLRAALPGTNNGTTRAVNARRLSDSVACDFLINTSGNLGGTSASCTAGAGLSLTAFAGTDATATCSIAGTTATCTGASSTPHNYDLLTGSGVTQPCVAISIGTFSGGSGTVTLGGSGSSPCGTVGSEAMTFTWGLQVPVWYSLNGNGYDSTNSTPNQQPFIVPICANGKPGILGLNGLGPGGAEFFARQTSWPGLGFPQPWTLVSVAERFNNFTTSQTSIDDDLDPSINIAYPAFANAVTFGYPVAGTLTASDQVLHMLALVGNGASSIGVVDNATSVSAGSFTDLVTSPLYIMLRNFDSIYGCQDEVWVIPGALTPSTPAMIALHTSISGYWGTP